MSDEKMTKKIYDGKVCGNSGRGRPCLTFVSIKDTRGRSLKKHEDPQRAYEEVDDSGRGKRGMTRP